MKIKIFKNFPRNIDNPNRKSDNFLFLLKIKIAEVNIINDDVAQYKFYQGFVREKGTSNALSKIFDALASADKESIDFLDNDNHDISFLNEYDHGFPKTNPEICFELIYKVLEKI